MLAGELAKAMFFPTNAIIWGAIIKREVSVVEKRLPSGPLEFFPIE